MTTHKRDDQDLRIVIIGAGMSGIAEVMLSLGYRVQGSDLKPSKITQRLSEKGARIFMGQAADNLDGAEVVVISSACSGSADR